ncbi:MAG: tetratricopeptide repeat protein [Dermatophilaceae bacterium]|nr:tetratricopeptide repeat protein [Dermatophilaceae bacterium]
MRRDPKDPRAHLALARAYTAAAAPQLATIEYLAVTRLDRTDPEANAALALVALASGRPEEAVKLVDTALAAHPGHPEALYARGIDRLMGLGQVEAGKQDLDAYLVAAPFGSHRAAVETLLAMIPRGATK